MEKKTDGVYEIQAPCKINVHLSIGNKRPDGFHDLESIFATLALSDTLRFERMGGEGESILSINHEISGQALPVEQNLVLKAVSLFRERTGFRAAFRIRLDKRIPAGAGLGGGSSDAASTLLALNHLADQPLSGGELSEMAALLGSDVPFFLAGGAAFVSGRGERVEPVKSPQGLWVVLVQPPFSSDTSCAYRLLDRERRPVREGLLGRRLSKKALIRALEDDPATWPFYNDFLPVFLEQGGTEAAAYRSVLENLRNSGASFAGLSGSGSCCFGVFTAEKMAKNAEKTLSSGKNNTILTFFLAQKANVVLLY